MYINEWMIMTIAALFGICAFTSFKIGRKEGLLLGIEGTFNFLEKYNVITFLKDGSIKGARGKVPVGTFTLE